MGRKRLFILIFIFFICRVSVYSQKVLPQNYFISPIDINPIVTGAFGELRPDHFHSGLDFATQNKTGLNVYCIADGYVSRIKISSDGYGRAIYITHPNGFVSVYAHLNEFNVVVEDYVKLKQYEKKSFEIELFPNKALFKFKKGDIIGYSGNSGSSTGPHLHFEIRNEATERPYNPLLFGYAIPDKESPDISEICVYPVSANSLVDGNKQKACLDVVKKENSFCLARKDTMVVSGGIAFGVEAYDKQNLPGRNGIYSLEIRTDGLPFFKIALDSVSFSDGRYINTLIDYPEYVASRKRIIQTYISRGNRLKIYSDKENRGIVYFNDTLLHTISVAASDFNNNTAFLVFLVKSATPSVTGQTTLENKLPLFRYGLKNHYENKDILLDLPSNALYDSIYFEYAVKPRTKYCYSALHQIHNKYTPLHTAATLMIKPDTVVSDTLSSKLTLAEVSGGNFSFVKSEWKNGYLSAHIRKFGSYAVVADTTAPAIKPSGNINNKKVAAGNALSFTISDDFSGIDKYNLSINGKWVLAEYDAKNDLLIYKADPAHFHTGKNDLELTVTDNLNNIAVYRSTLLY
ncbi:MAG TPA: M23 family metallopeptidase [Bacteroidales bacterium]|nr:M23 family metallopeptidase [Bacteroidales bacterium]